VDNLLFIITDALITVKRCRPSPSYHCFSTKTPQSTCSLSTRQVTAIHKTLSRHKWHETFAARSLRQFESLLDSILFSYPSEHCLNPTAQERARMSTLEDGSVS